MTEAHARRKLVVAHVTQAAVLDIILEAGVDVLAHAPTAPQVFAGEIENLRNENGRISFNPDYEAQLSRLVKQGVIMVPTINAIDEVTCSALYQTYHLNNQWVSLSIAKIWPRKKGPRIV